MAETYIIPIVGSKGKYTFKEPFNQEDYEKQELTVSAVRTFKELQDSNIDVFKTVYNLVGLTETDLLSDITNSVPIVVFTSTSGDYLYVPANRVTGLPDTSGIKYQQIILAINLGLMPLDFNLKTAKQTVWDSVYDTLGVESEVQEIKSSGIVPVDPVEDLRYKRLLESRKTQDTSFRTKYYRLKDQFERLQEQYKKLENWVLELKGGQRG